MNYPNVIQRIKKAPPFQEELKNSQAYKPGFVSAEANFYH